LRLRKERRSSSQGVSAGAESSPASRERLALVTGATSGLGRWTALGLVRAGYRVIAVGRDRRKCDALRAWIEREVASASLDCAVADLSLMREVRLLSRRVLDREGKLDLLVNNAGVFAATRRLTGEGHELTLAVNHLAPFLLTRELLPALQAARSARIVNVGSSASDRAALDLDDLQGARRWTMYGAYAQSKLAMMCATFELVRRLGPDGPTANVVHPGTAATEICREGAVGMIWSLLRPFLLSPEKGARPTLFLATNSDLTTVTGTYFKRAAPAAPNPVANDAALAGRLWSVTEDLVDRPTTLLMGQLK
jgi:NAD(P)-dependent dehydrogenase (short-subunit alcohol dehydrogenase family)